MSRTTTTATTEFSTSTFYLLAIVPPCSSLSSFSKCFRAFLILISVAAEAEIEKITLTEQLFPIFNLCNFTNKKKIYDMT